MLLTSPHTGLSIFERAPSTFQFLGLDFMVTRDLRTWFIEANNYPLWPKGTPFIDKLMSTLGVSAGGYLYYLVKLVLVLDLLIYRSQAKFRVWHIFYGLHNTTVSSWG